MKRSRSPPTTTEFMPTKRPRIPSNKRRILSMEPEHGSNAKRPRTMDPYYSKAEVDTIISRIEGEYETQLDLQWTFLSSIINEYIEHTSRRDHESYIS